MEIKPLYIILLDISGYTRFIHSHKNTLLHAEKIVIELLESILKEVRSPLIIHEILGDAVSLYAVDDGSPGNADEIYRQVQQFFDAFKSKEAKLVSDCSMCVCEACNNVGRLKLKAILHCGEAAFATIMGGTKISGEDIIAAHRLLKNSIPSDEYVLLTGNFKAKLISINETNFKVGEEQYSEIGKISTFTRIFEFKEVPKTSTSIFSKFAKKIQIEFYALRRKMGLSKPDFRNLSSGQSTA